MNFENLFTYLVLLAIARDSHCAYRTTESELSVDVRVLRNTIYSHLSTACSRRSNGRLAVTANKVSSSGGRGAIRQRRLSCWQWLAVYAFCNRVGSFTSSVKVFHLESMHVFD